MAGRDLVVVLMPRVVYGNSFSENGWPMVNSEECTWVTVPGTSVSLQIQNGQPLAILRAFAADFNAYVEPLRDPDSACWTPTNSVSTSNHLSGTACDFNWNDHPFQVSYAGFSSKETATVRELLDFYEQTVFWGQDWQSPKDAMHFQVGYNTYQNPHTADFIARKIRADGFSTFRRGNSVVLSIKDRHALATINEGKRLGITPKGICIAIAVELVETNLTMYANSNVPASLGYPHEKVGSDHDSTGLFQQRQAWGPLSETMDPTLSARLFFLGGHSGQRGLTDFDYNSNSRTPGGWAQAVQVSAFPYRYDERYTEAQQIYARLSNLGDEDMAQVPQDQWDTLYRLFTQPTVGSVSMYSTPGEGPIYNLVQLIQSIDGAAHKDLTVEADAKLGDLEAIGRIARVAAGQGSRTDAAAVAHAKAFLAELEATNPAVLQEFISQKGQS